MTIETHRELDGAALRIVLAAPKANVLDAAMIGAIRRALAEDVDRHTRLLVFEGAGKHFSFGASVAEHTKEEAPAMLEAFHGLFRQLDDLSVPTCAVVRGRCLGGGLELASWCSWVVATPDAVLGQPEIALAVFPPMASLLLPWRASGATALDLCVSGRSVTADEALRLGVVDAVSEDPDAWWRERAKPLLATSATSLRFAERAARSTLRRQLNEELPGLEDHYLRELMATHDANEGIAAFLERRKPDYRDE